MSSEDTLRTMRVVQESTVATMLAFNEAMMSPMWQVFGLTFWSLRYPHK